MVDTGSAVSILPMSVYTGFFSQSPVSPLKLSLDSFGGDAIEMKGCLPAKEMEDLLAGTTLHRSQPADHLPFCHQRVKAEQVCL